jgi:hypothetical protein
VKHAVDVGTDAPGPAGRVWRKLAIVALGIVTGLAAFVTFFVGWTVWVGGFLGDEPATPDHGAALVWWGITVGLLLLAPLVAWWRLRRWTWVAAVGVVPLAATATWVTLIVASN